MSRSFKPFSLPASEIRHRHGYLLIALPPLLIVCLAHAIFAAVSGNDATEFVQSLKTATIGSDQISQILLMNEAHARYRWLAAALVNIAIPLYAGYIGIVTIVNCLEGRRLLFMSGWVMLLSVLSLTSLFISIQNDGALHRLVFAFTYETLETSHHFVAEFLHNVHIIISTINILAAIVPAIVILAASSALAPAKEQNTDLDFIAERMKSLNRVLNATAALLVVGVLHMNAWLQWPAALINDSSLRNAVSETAQSITLFWGTTFTLMLISLYWPATTQLCQRAKQLLESQPEAAGKTDPQQWLREHDLANTFKEQLPQIGKMLAPFIAGPLASIFIGTG